MPSSAAAGSSPSRAGPRRTAGRWTCPPCARRPARPRWSGSATPTTPPASPEPDGAIETLLAGLEADAAADGRPVPVVVVDEAYSEFTGSSVIPLRTRFPNLVAVRTASKAYALAGLRVGFAVARAGDAPPRRPVPAAGLHRHDLGDGGGRGAPRPVGDAREPGPRGAGAPPPGRRPRSRRLASPAVGHQLHPARPRHGRAVRDRGPRADGAGASSRARSGTATRWPTASA